MFGSIETRQDSWTFNFSAFQNLGRFVIPWWHPIYPERLCPCGSYVHSQCGSTALCELVVLALYDTTKRLPLLLPLPPPAPAAAPAAAAAPKHHHQNTAKHYHHHSYSDSYYAQRLKRMVETQMTQKCLEYDDTSTSRAMCRTHMFGWTTVPFHKGVARKGQVDRNRDRVRVI